MNCTLYTSSPKCSVVFFSKRKKPKWLNKSEDQWPLIVHRRFVMSFERQNRLLMTLTIALHTADTCCWPARCWADLHYSTCFPLTATSYTTSLSVALHPQTPLAWHTAKSTGAISQTTYIVIHISALRVCVNLWLPVCVNMRSNGNAKMCKPMRRRNANLNPNRCGPAHNVTK